jgi:hypothetical protein
MTALRRDASRWPAGERACIWCGTVKRFRSGKRFCGYRCAALARTIAIPESTQRRIAQTASRAAADKRRAAVEAKVQGMDAVTAYRYGYALGQTAGYNSGRYRALRDRRMDDEASA